VSFTVTSVPDYSIALDSSAYTFPGAAPSYGDPDVKIVTVSNRGSHATGPLTIAKSGSHADSFTVSKTDIGDIAVGGNDSFTVVPVTGLAAGTYTATITVSGGNSITAALTVSFTVGPIYTVTFDADGGTPANSTAQTSAGSNTVTLPRNPTRASYIFGGWYTDRNGAGQSFTGTTQVTADITVYAKWISGSGTGPASINVTISIADERIDLTKSTEDALSKERSGYLHLTAPEGYDRYTWRVDGSNGNYASMSEREIVVYAGWFSSYGTHSVLLEFEKDGIPYGCLVLFKVVR
jgi:uncharacterized repeat protein (TIGR02543 family)